MPNRTTPLTTPVLGRGQGARTAAAAVSREGELALAGALTIPIEQIAPDPAQPRRTMDEEGLRELAASLVEYGVLQPLLVREEGRLDDGRTRYRIVAGGRRYAAALLAGLTRLPVVVRDTEGATLRLTQLIENVQRQDLAPMDEARAFQELMDVEHIKTATDLAKRLHLSSQTVSDRLLLLSDQPIGDAVERGQIGTAVARDILRAADAVQADVRGRLEAGERITKVAVKEARERATAAGITNERAKGGGRGTRRSSPTETAMPVALTEEDHNRYDPAGATRRDTSLDDALQGMDRVTLARALAYGATREWTCRQLLDALNDQAP